MYTVLWLSTIQYTCSLRRRGPMAARPTVGPSADGFASSSDAAGTVERGSSRAARGSEQLPRARLDAAAAPVLAIEQEAGQPAQGEAQGPPPRLGLWLAYRLCLSPILVGQRGALPDEYVPAGRTPLQKILLRASSTTCSRQTRSRLLRCYAWGSHPRRHLCSQSRSSKPHV